MMMEIKFRAWDKENEEMIPAEAWYFGHDELEPFVDTMVRIKERFEVMQYAGLLDKQGKEIYKGDRVETCCETSMGTWIDREGVIYWDDVHAGFYIEYIEGDAVPISLPDEITIVGNIYENPEPAKELV